MTIIITAFDPQYVVQVSDRRLTTIDLASRRLLDIDDNGNKAIFWCGRMAFSYSGLAQFGSNHEKTDVWLSRVLAEHYEVMSRTGSAIAVFESVRDRATQYFRQLPSWCLIPHAFVSAGWARPLDEETNYRFFIKISNLFDERGNELPAPSNQFSIIHAYLSEKEGGINITGQNLDRHDVHTLKRYLGTVSSKQLPPKTTIQVVANFIRRLAQSNPLVGKNLMSVCIPRGVLKQEKPMLSNRPPNNDTASFLYLNETNPGGVTYWPNWSCDGALSNIKTSGKRIGELEIAETHDQSNP